MEEAQIEVRPEIEDSVVKLSIAIRAVDMDETLLIADATVS